MSRLIEGFKKEHSGIIEALKEVEELGVLTKDGQAKLMFLVVDLLNHVWKEDEWLYPDLRKTSEHNKKLAEILRFFVNGLGAIHEEILNFFTKYSNGIVDSNFKTEYESIFSTLRKRIEWEENTLYDEYNKLYH
jgi:hypothetical protein